MLGSAVGRAGLPRGEGEAVDEAVGVGDNRDNLDAGDTAFAGSCGNVDPASRVSGVPHRYFHFSIREIFDDA